MQEENNSYKHLSNPVVINESLVYPETPNNNSPSYTSSISVLIGERKKANEILNDLYVNDGVKQSSEAVQEERNKQSCVVDTESNVPDEVENHNVNVNAKVSKGQN